ncbi:MAG: ABC transporter permease [Actinomycetota bacterium]
MRVPTAKVLLVARRELFQRARSRAFRIGTAIVALAAVGFVVLPSALAGAPSTRRVGVVGEHSASFRAALSTAAAAFDTEVTTTVYADVRAGQRALRSGDADVLLVGSDELVWKQGADPELSAIVASAVQAAEQQRVIHDLGLSPEEAAALLQPTPIRSRALEPVSEDEAARMGLATIALVLLFSSISVFGGFLVTGVIEEKANRVVEVLLSRARPDELLAGKVLGMGLLGLGQVLLVGACVLAALLAVGTADLPEATPGMVGWVVLWFVLGYAFYSVVYAATGALASRQEDAQSVSVPVTMLSLGAYFLSFVAMESPDGLLARVCSFLPPTAPFVMAVRAAVGTVTLWEVGMAVLLMALSIYGLIKLGGRIYAGAILRIGPKVRLRDAWRAAGS